MWRGEAWPEEAKTFLDRTLPAGILQACHGSGLFSSPCSEVPMTVGHKEENCCRACTGASRLLLHLLIKGCGHLTLFM